MLPYSLLLSLNKFPKLCPLNMLRLAVSETQAYQEYISSAFVVHKFSLTWVSVISLYSVCIFKQASNSSLATCASS